jgi:hypothetical protein
MESAVPSVAPGPDGYLPLGDVRRLRLLELSREYPNLSQFAIQIQRQPSYVSHILSGRKKLGETLSRRIEQLTGRPRGWLDHQDGVPLPTPVERSREALELADAWESIPDPGLKSIVRVLVLSLGPGKYRPRRPL